MTGRGRTAPSSPSLRTAKADQVVRDEPCLGTRFVHPDLSAINTADDADAARLLVRFVENAPHLAAAVACCRPFVDVAAVADAIQAAVTSLEPRTLVEFFRAHPVLSPADPAAMTAESQSEQARLSLTSADDSLRNELATLNARYMAQFDFPFIIALHRVPDIASLLQTFRTRLDAPRAAEIITNRDEILSVSRARVIAAFGTSD